MILMECMVGLFVMLGMLYWLMQLKLNNGENEYLVIAVFSNVVDGEKKVNLQTMNVKTNSKEEALGIALNFLKGNGTLETYEIKIITQNKTE